MFLIFYGKIEKKISINKEDFLHREEERMKEPVLIVMAAGMGIYPNIQHQMAY